MRKDKTRAAGGVLLFHGAPFFAAPSGSPRSHFAGYRLNELAGSMTDIATDSPWHQLSMPDPCYGTDEGPGTRPNCLDEAIGFFAGVPRLRIQNVIPVRKGSGLSPSPRLWPALDPVRRMIGCLETTPQIEPDVASL